MLRNRETRFSTELPRDLRSLKRYTARLNRNFYLGLFVLFVLFPGIVFLIATFAPRPKERYIRVQDKDCLVVQRCDPSGPTMTCEERVDLNHCR